MKVAQQQTTEKCMPKKKNLHVKMTKRHFDVTMKHGKSTGVCWRSDNDDAFVKKNNVRPLVRSLWDSKLLLQRFLELGKKNDMAEFLSVS